MLADVAYECNVCGKRFSISSNARRHDRACHSQEAIQAAANRQLALNKLLEEASCRTYSRDDNSSPSASAGEESESTRSLPSSCPSSPEYQYQSELLPQISKMTLPTSTIPQGRSFSLIKSLERQGDSIAVTSSYYPSSRRTFGPSISPLLFNNGEADRGMKQEDDPVDIPGTRQTNSAQCCCESMPTTNSK